MPNVTSKTHLLGGDDWPTVVERAAGMLPQTLNRTVAVSVQSQGPAEQAFAMSLISALRSRSSKLDVLAASSALAGWLRARSESWVEVDLRGRGDRLGRATMPSALVDAESVVAINDLTSFNPRRPVIAIGAWAEFAHPRQRLGAAWSDQATGLAAEIALAAPPAIYFIGASWCGKPMLIVADDMIAAEVTGLAVGQAQADPDSEHIGPWEQPLVQRASDLGLGVRLPSQIDFSVEWLGDESLAAAFRQFGASVAARFGVSLTD